MKMIFIFRNLTLLCFLFFFTKTAFTQQQLYVVSDIKTHKIKALSDSNSRLVLLKAYLSPLVTDFKYATHNNFTNKILYKKPEAYLRLPAAIALGKVNMELMKEGYCLKVFDAYRPYSVTKKMWEIVSDERYTANPAKGSGHNRGIAVDVTIIHLATGEELQMPTPYDDFTEKAHHDYMDLPAEIIANRKRLRDVMEKYGFVALETEWWHYSLPNPTNYDVMDLSFKQLKQL